MKQDERGYVLILVLVTMAALAVLSLAAIQVNLATNKQTNIRVDETQLETDVKGVLDVLVADLRTEFPLHGEDEVKNYMENQQLFQAKVETVLKNNIAYTGTRQSGDNDIRYSITRSTSDETNAPFTTVLTLSATGTTKAKPEQPMQTSTYSQEVYLTALPSFLYYVLGSDDKLTVNGPPKIEGDLFAGTKLALNRDATYQLENKIDTLKNSDTSRFYLDGRIDLGNASTCGGCDAPNYFTNSITPGVNHRPEIGPVESSFSRFNLDYSVIQFANRYRNGASKLPYTDPPQQTLFQSAAVPTSTFAPFLKQTYVVEGNPKPLERWTEFIDSSKLNAIQTLQVVNLPVGVNGPMVVTKSIASSNVPLLLNGDVTIDALDTITISRPLIINGNLTIRGKVAFNTTVYALGDAFIDRADLLPVATGANDSSLVLLAEGKILLNRINEFQDSSSTLQAFMYSASTEPTRLYSVGSIVNLKGGLYSKGPLEVNTFRGSFKSLPQQANKQAYFAPGNVDASPDVNKSRLVMEYNEGVFRQIDTLPVTNQLQLFVGQQVRR
ncbi:hypothetical protein EVJ27_10290 [Exiguobacterium sp. SH3S2]|uniref:hypothetical protein n=1 Tax=unclassified Exiguobacterium TaxID=2644629 RepID=UPI00103B5926|nr:MULTISPECIES: hypothetical protein [unclassified Exiguobacterium]TCI43348.1 hypothetical protein EVJ28_10310 [Exiguobacterium sp. SH3S3]TCI59194.1 hypothetical protein EVJ27_10290 [Exiguobacterium sp. SH3S2]